MVLVIMAIAAEAEAARQKAADEKRRNSIIIGIVAVVVIIAAIASLSLRYKPNNNGKIQQYRPSTNPDKRPSTNSQTNYKF